MSKEGEAKIVEALSAIKGALPPRDSKISELLTETNKTLAEINKTLAHRDDTTDVLQEHFFFTLTTITANGFLIATALSKVSWYLVIPLSFFVSFYALRLIADRAARNATVRSRCADFHFVWKERSAALFYSSLVLFSFVGVVLTHDGWKEVIRYMLG